jgi:uncharacterized protein YkwD
MHRRYRLLTVLVAAAGALAAFAPAAGAACADEDLAYSDAVRARVEQAVTCLVNVERNARGLPALRTDARLGQSAYGHSADMAQQNYFSHTGLDSSTPGTRITAAGYPWTTYGENIAAGYRSAKAVMLGWMASTGHCQNILRSSFADIGVGAASGPGLYGVYWTQNFGRLSGSGPDSTAAAGCPFQTLATGEPGVPPADVPDSGAGNCSAASGVSLRITSVRRRHGGKLRVAGAVSGASCCPQAQFRVKRGGRSTSVQGTICGGRFAMLLRVPRAHGSARVTVSLAGGGPSARRTIRL